MFRIAKPKYLVATMALAIASIFMVTDGVEARNIYTVSRVFDPPGGPDPALRTVDLDTGATVNTVNITLVGFTVEGGTGLAMDPTTQVLYVMLKVAEDSDRWLVTVDPVSGVATLIGDTGRKFADIAFDDVGVLYGVTGRTLEGHTIFTLDKTDASSTLFLALATGDFGDAIAYNPEDGHMYRASDDDSLGQVFESINLTTKAVTNIPLSGSLPLNQVAGMTYEGLGTFLAGDIADTGPVYRITTAGVGSFVRNVGHTVTGLVALDQFSCIDGGFKPPFDKPLTLNSKTKKSIPLKMMLVDPEGFIITDDDLSSPPVVNVMFSAAAAGDAQSPDTSDLLPLGQASEDNVFVYDIDSETWSYILGTRQYSAAGTYTVRAVAGDSSYGIDSSCSGEFERLD